MSNSPIGDTSKKSNQAGLISVVIAIVAIAALIAGWFYFTAPSPAKFQPLVRALSTGNMKKEPTGLVDISNSFPGVVPKNQIDITRRPDGSLLVLIPTYRTRGNNLGGFMYTSRPLRDSDVYTRARGLNFARPRINIGEVHKLIIDKRINEHWYRVSYGLE